MHYVLFILTCLIWGASFILMKKAHDAFGPVAIGAGRSAMGAAVLFLVLRLSRRHGKRIARRDLAWLLFPGIIGAAYPWVMQPYLIGHYQASGFFGMMVSLVPLLTIVVSIPMLGVFPSRRELFGVLGGLVCLYILFDDGQHRGITAVSFLLATTVPLSYALSNTLIKRRLSHVPSQHLGAMVLLIATLVLTPISVATEGIEPSETTWTIGGAVAAIAFLGIFGTGLATWWFYILIQQRGPLFAGMATYVVSSLAVAWGWYDAEHVTVTQVAALAGVLTMVALVQWPGGRTKEQALETESA